MINVSPETALIIMFGSLAVVLFAGFPIALGLGGVAVVSVLLLWGPEALALTATSAYGIMNYYILVAVPFFLFMAMVLRGSGIAEDLFRSVRLWFGRVPGGLAIGAVLICTIMGAMSGIIATGLLTMGVLALPLMLKLNYNKTMAIGPIMAGGSLGDLIPPSVTFVIYGALATVSIGKLFLGGLIPGLILSAMYMTYIAVRCYFKPELGPPLPPEERVGLKEKIISLKSAFLPGVLIMAVLGTLFMGVCSPTEAAGAGAVGAIVCAAIHRKLSWPMIREASYITFKITGMCMWIMLGAYCFRAVFAGVGGPELARNFVSGLHVAPIFVIFLMQLSYIFLGCFIEDMAILMITIPVYLPIVIDLGYSPVWFGVLFLVNMQIACLTPPFGFGLFYMRGVAPPEITMGDIYRSVIPFIPLQLIGLALVIFYPQLALWLPGLVFESIS